MSLPTARGRGRSAAVKRIVRPGTDETVQPPPVPEIKKVVELKDDKPKENEPFEIPKRPILPLASFVKRPNFCSKGVKYRVHANHFELRVPDQGLRAHQYSVRVFHERIKLNLDDNRLIMWNCIAHHPETFTDATSLAYDGQSILFSLNQLSFTNQQGITVSSHFTFDVQESIDRDDATLPFKVQLRYLGPITLNLGSRRCLGINEEYTLAPIQVMDIILRQYRQTRSIGIASRFVSLRNNIFAVPDGIGQAISSFVEVWDGLHHAVSLGQNAIPYLNADVKYGAFYAQYMKNEAQQNVDVDLVTFLCTLHNEKASTQANLIHPNQLNQRFSFPQNSVPIVNRIAKLLFIKTTHMTSNRRYRLNGLSDKTANSFTFETMEFGMVSVAEYFTRKYNRTLQYPNLQMVQVSRVKQSIFLPIEVCVLAKKQHYNKKLDEGQTSKIIKKATFGGAPDRQQKTMAMMGRAEFHRDKFMEKFGIQIKQQMTEIDGHLMPLPTIRAIRDKQMCDMKIDYQNSWRFAGTGFGFVQPCRIDFVGVVVICKPEHFNLGDTGRNITGIVNNMQAMGCTVGSLQREDVMNALKMEHVETILAQFKQKIDQLGTQKTSIVFVIMHAKNSYDYSKIKHKAEIDLGLMTQVILKKNLGKLDIDVNIAMKVNLKMMGTNTSMVAERIAMEYLFETSTLLIGIDVSHPGPLDTRSPSVAAVVANIDPTCARFATSIKVQKFRRESMVHVKSEVTARLMHYFTITRTKPHRLIVYRDGVSESQFEKTLNEELSSIRTACLDLDSLYKPKITFIVVNKRHNTRLYPTAQKDSCGKAGNVPPGLLVDDTITNPFVFDFFLCSHYGIQGTSKAAKYTVLHDDSGMTVEQVALITYCTTFLYQRCARSVSIPAPVYYAHLACSRALSHIQAFMNLPESTTASSTSSKEVGQPEADVNENELTRCVTVAESLSGRMYFT